MERIRAYKTLSTKVIVVLAMMAIFVLALSVGVLSEQSLRLDESQSLWQSSHSLSRIAFIVAQDVHTPFYLVMLHYWQEYFGNDVASARYLSLLFYILGIFALYVLGRRIFSSSVGLFASVLFAISPFMNWYGNEIRMYSLLTLLTILNHYFFIGIYQNKYKGGSEYVLWGAYTLTALLGLYTHYFFIFSIFAQLLFYSVYYRSFKVESLNRFALSAATVAILFIPWLIYVRQLGFASTMRPYIPAPEIINVFNTFSNFFFGFQGDYLNSILLSFWPLVILIGFLALQRNMRVTPETIYLLSTVFIPIILLFLLSIFITPLYLSRYLIFTLPSLYLLLSWMLSSYPARISWAIKNVVVVVMLVTLSIQLVSVNTPVKENYREASLYLSENASAQDIIVLSAPFTIYPIEYYYYGQAAISTFPVWDRYQFGPIPEFTSDEVVTETQELKKHYQKLWLLLSYDQGYEEDIRLYFDMNFERLEKRTFSHNLTLHVYQLRYDNEDIDTALTRLNASP